METPPSDTENLPRWIRLRRFVARNERPLSVLAFLSGVVWDNLTLTRIDQTLDLFILSAYLIGGGGAVILMNLAEARRFADRAIVRVVPYLPLVVQFFFGGIMSTFFVFYSRSGSILTSWPFLLILVALLVGNEFIKRRYARLVINVSIYYFALFSFAIFIVPIAVKQMNILTFLASGVLSLIAILLFLLLLKHLLPEQIAPNRGRLALAIGGIYLAVNGLYLVNAIPPIPLSLKEIGVYHNIERTAEGYRAVYEDNELWRPWRSSARTYHWDGSSPIHVFSSIFAPTNLSTTVYHEWSRWSDAANRWEERGRIAYAITGGREEGYRGYTQKSAIEEGLWRVQVETARGAVIGQVRFEVIRGEPEELVVDEK